MPTDAIDPVEPAHLNDTLGWSPRIHRYLPATDLTTVVRRHWIPVWSLPVGETSVQRVLQYPVCLLVVAPDRAEVVGPATGLGAHELRGTGWTFGTLLQPAAGAPLLGTPVGDVVDGAVPLTALDRIDGARLARDVRAALSPDPSSERGHRAGAAVVESHLRRLLPIDHEGDLANRVVEFVETHPEVRRVDQLGAEFGIGERTLQRLAVRRLGLTPKWLIRRRRLQEAAAGLHRRSAAPDLAGLAAELGYADQAHFSRDFRSVTGMTPGQYAAEPHPG